jgi:hypothetical protein
LYATNIAQGGSPMCDLRHTTDFFQQPPPLLRGRDAAAAAPGAERHDGLATG